MNSAVILFLFFFINSMLMFLLGMYFVLFNLFYFIEYNILSIVTDFPLKPAQHG